MHEVNFMNENELKSIERYFNKFNEDAASFNEFEANDFIKLLKNNGRNDDAIEVGNTFLQMAPSLKGYINQYGYALYNKFINIDDEKIKEKEEEMVALIAENARVGSYTDEFDERYRRIAEEITTLKEEQIEARRKTKLADSYEQRLKDMDSFLEKQTCQIPEFDNDLVRRLIASIKVVSAEKLIIQFQSGIVMEQEIRYE